MQALKLETPLLEALGAKNSFLRKLEKLDIRTVGELLRHFPSRYEDFSHVAQIAELAPGEEATVQGTIRDTCVRYTRRRGMAIIETVVEDATGAIRAIWYNQPYLASAFRTGRLVNLAGKVSISESGELYFSHPAHEFISSTSSQQPATSNQFHTGRLVPIYPETRGLTSRGLRFLISGLLKRRLSLDEWLPGEILQANDFPALRQAFAAVHFPEALDQALAAKRRFLFEDLFLLQLANLQQKLALATETAPAIPADIEFIRRLLAELPFELTQSQKRSLWEILQDMEKPHPMNRLLQGDVGSGKTIIAALSALTAIKAGYQTAFMAPTEILARQHFETMRKLFLNLKSAEQPVFGLLTASNAQMVYPDGLQSAVKKPDFQKKVADGEIAILFGTHALIQKNVAFKKLGLVIVDEQHRFGVRQRAALLKSGGRKAIPHFLSMSATPIPRTLMLTVFGDLDVSLITELPAGRQPIETKVVMPLERNKTYQFVREKIKEGRQAFVICPRIEESVEETGTGGSFPLRGEIKRGQIELKSVKTEYEKLSKKIFPDLTVAMLHGQMKAKEKEEIMRKFVAGETDVLVSTSVIEVGVDVPNASVMLIEGADRFGLAQLYQFRGRIGRGAHKSYCFLFTDSESESTKARLKAILTAQNGFELAEKDLALRGPGQFFGETQSGLPDIAMDALRDPELVKESREAAATVLRRDRALEQHPVLRARLTEFRKGLHLE
jgi:ATP-dependent DNA helicase RecG